MDGAIECKPGACDGKDGTEQQSKAFDLLVDLCSPTGHKLWIDFSTGMATPLFPKEAFSDCILKLGRLQGIMRKKTTCGSLQLNVR